MKVVRNHRRSIVWLPGVHTGENPKTGKKKFVPGPLGRRMRLKPGLNHVEDEQLEFARKHKTSGFWFRKGSMGRGKGAMLEVEEAPVEIGDMTVEEATKMIAEETDEMKLVYWIDRVSTKGAKDAIERRLAQLKAPAGSADAAG